MKEERKYLFNDTHNTFILWLYGKGPLSERKHIGANTWAERLAYTSRGALGGMRNRSMYPPLHPEQEEREVTESRGVMICLGTRVGV